VVPNALARSDSTCPTLSDGFRMGSQAAGWLMARNGVRWTGISARRFAFDAYSYGCGDGVQAGGGLFAQALLAPLTDLHITWRQLPDGSARLCHYITGAPGTRGTIDLVGAGGSLGAQPYELSPDGYGFAAWNVPPGAYHVEFRTARGVRWLGGVLHRAHAAGDGAGGAGRAPDRRRAVLTGDPRRG